MPKDNTTQQELIDFVKDTENIKKAVEGSMDKRNKVMNTTPKEEINLINKNAPIELSLRLAFTENDAINLSYGQMIAAVLKWHEAETLATLERLKEEAEFVTSITSVGVKRSKYMEELPPEARIQKWYVQVSVIDKEIKALKLGE